MKDFSDDQSTAEKWQKECAAGREAANATISDLRRSGNVPQFTRDLITAMETEGGYKIGFASIIARAIPRSTDT